ncbi:dienelactone hydrolase family protein [Flavobacterium psychroterrae]|uniref:Dienelactone hydrolase family protein n=1 Tax=Flavobacterium psychroterrae TaxID=2133767 RepID=A0ABS5P732_9FLAO|nr:dienelactone hydrolase family protein [Flavobacterium psychroterrae]MBS7229600.1 dienelactone hydrolase family protein [Flavobacterium psychroterrae]
MHQIQILKAGKTNGSKALILLHGRGASAQDIVSLTTHLKVDDFAFYAPQATGNSWYPNSFLAKPQENEPWLSSALDIVRQVVEQAQKNGITKDNIYFLGFSQGACLTAEFIARNASKYGGAVIFTGGLIGDQIYPENYSGNFEGTPVFIGTSNPDFHVPVERVYATTNILKEMGAEVTEKVYDNMGHTISMDEIDLANKHIFAS